MTDVPGTPSVADGGETAEGRRLVALAEIGVIAPFLILGIVMTLTIWFAYFGIPLLIVIGPVAYLAASVRRDPADDDLMRWLAAASVAVAAVLTAALVGLVVVGIDDLDAPLDLVALVCGAAWVVWAWTVAMRAWRAARGH